jgi:type V secretory pathway adhesin AidA
MSRVLYCLLLLTSALAAGCAGSRDNLAADTAPAATPAVAVAAAATPVTAVAASVAQAAPADGAAPATTMVDGNQLAARSADTLLCRELLVRGSNQIRRMCGTTEQWRVYERREAQAAGEMVRRMQQGRPEQDVPRRR